MATTNNRTELPARQQEFENEEKYGSVSTAASGDTQNNPAGNRRRDSVDKAYDFLHQIDTASSNGQYEADPRMLRRKIDKVILPVLYMLYFFHYLDKYLMSYAIVMGLPEDLKLHGYQLNNSVSAISWSYLAMTVIIPLALNKLPVGKWVGANMLCCGVITACTAASQGYGSLLACRLLMGIFDASITPSLMLLSSQYYRKDEQALRFAFWFSAIGPSIIIGGAMSYGFQNLTHSMLESWRIMYLTCGLASGTVGLCAILFLPDTPMNARFLTNPEKRTILQYVSVNGTGISNKRFEKSQLKAVFLDPQVWLLFLAITVIVSGSAILATYGTTIIRGFGYTSKQAALLNMPGGAFTFIAVVAFAFLIRYNWLSRIQAIVIGLILAITGTCLLAFLPAGNHIGQLFGLWMVSFSAAEIGIMYQWMAANVAGHTKRSVSSTLLSAAVAVGGIIGPYALRPQDAPKYHLARIVLLVCKLIAFTLVLILGAYYLWINKRRDKLHGRPEDMVTPDDNSETWANLTDQERKSFRYVL